MTEHSFGLRPKPNGQAGAPVVGVERTTIGSAADVRQRGIRETNTAAAAKQKVPSFGERFEEDPLKTIGVLLQEVSAGLKGTEGPGVKAQALQFQRDAQTLKAIEFGVEQLEKFPEGSQDALISTIGNISPEAAAVLSEISKEGVEKARALMDLFNENSEMFPGASKLAKIIGVKETVKIYGGIAAKVAEQKALAPLRTEEAGGTAEATAAGKAAGTPPEAKTKVVKFRDEEGNQVTTLIDSDTGKTIKEIGRGPTVVFQPPEVPGKKAKGEIETRLIDGAEALARLHNIQSKFKPEFLQIFPRLKVKGLKALEKLGLDLSPEDKATISEYSIFTRGAFENINLEIKRITGAQMSEEEADRLRKGIPDPENDGPTEFLSKLNDSVEQISASLFRLEALRKIGFRGKVTNQIAQQIPLSRYLPPKDEPDAVLVSTDDDGNPIFRRPDGSTFKEVP